MEHNVSEKLGNLKVSQSPEDVLSETGFGLSYLECHAARDIKSMKPGSVGSHGRLVAQSPEGEVFNVEKVECINFDPYTKFNQTRIRGDGVTIDTFTFLARLKEPTAAMSVRIAMPEKVMPHDQRRSPDYRRPMESLKFVADHYSSGADGWANHLTGLGLPNMRCITESKLGVVLGEEESKRWALLGVKAYIEAKADVDLDHVLCDEVDDVVARIKEVKFIPLRDIGLCLVDAAVNGVEDFSNVTDFALNGIRSSYIDKFSTFHEDGSIIAVAQNLVRNGDKITPVRLTGTPRIICDPPPGITLFQSDIDVYPDAPMIPGNNLSMCRLILESYSERSGDILPPGCRGEIVYHREGANHLHMYPATLEDYSLTGGDLLTLTPMIAEFVRRCVIQIRNFLKSRHGGVAPFSTVAPMGPFDIIIRSIKRHLVGRELDRMLKFVLLMISIWTDLRVPKPLVEMHRASFPLDDVELFEWIWDRIDQWYHSVVDFNIALPLYINSNASRYYHACRVERSSFRVVMFPRPRRPYVPREPASRYPPHEGRQPLRPLMVLADFIDKSVIRQKMNLKPLSIQRKIRDEFPDMSDVEVSDLEIDVANEIAKHHLSSKPASPRGNGRGRGRGRGRGKRNQGRGRG
jgi:hypothetical protein